MKTDADIESERIALEPLIGPTRAGWYAEACRVEYDDPAALWACRYREMAREAGELERRLAALEAGLRDYRHCRHGCPDCACTRDARRLLGEPPP